MPSLEYINHCREIRQREENMQTYSSEDIPELKKRLAAARKEAKKISASDDLNNQPQREAGRLSKLIGLLEHRLSIQDYGSGTVLVNQKYVVSLSSAKWRIKGRNVWYNHKRDLTHFVCNYILKEDQVESPTPQEELAYFQTQLRILLDQKPEWLIHRLKALVNDEHTNL